jgi:septum formation protein
MSGQGAQVPVHRVVLASSSPRRRELLRSIGLRFVVREAAVDEAPLAGENELAYVTRLAGAKARACRAELGEVVIAADTIVVQDGDLLGKPRDRAEARAMLERLSGRAHRVLTGVALRRVADDQRPTDTQVEVSESTVLMAPLGAAEIAWYAATGEPDDKAGAYALQGLGGLFVERVEGNPGNVIGLPLPALYRLFRRHGLDLRDFLE